MPKVIKPSNHHECLLLLFNNISAPPQIFGCIDSFLLLPNLQKRRNDGDGFLGATAAGLF